jgi:transposase InsO family protein
MTKKSKLSYLSLIWIETWYNKRRRHSYLEYKTINEFNLEMYNKNIAT